MGLTLGGVFVGGKIMKEIDNETLVAAADKILDMLKDGHVMFSMPGQFGVGIKHLKYLIERQLNYPERNQFHDFASIEHLGWEISAHPGRQEKRRNKRRNLYIEASEIRTSIEFIDMYLNGELCMMPTDTYRPKVEEYRKYVEDFERRIDKSEKQRQYRLARTTNKNAKEVEEDNCK